MAKLPSINIIKREDFKDAPGWVEKLLSPLNSFIRTVYDALNGNLTFGQNVVGFIKELTITAGAAETDNTAEFLHGLKTTPQGVLVMQVTQVATQYTPVAASVGVSWRRGTSSIIIDAIAGLTNGEQYTIRLLVI